jgi:membrane protease YdiL (CAAX protease family)
VALIGPTLLLSVAAPLTLCFADRSEIAGLAPAELRELPDRFLFILLFIGLGGEPGWRGFALPQLQAKHSPLISSLILAPFWALWHLPPMGNEFPWFIVPAFLLSICGGTLVRTWLFNASKGSVLLVMLFHAITNTLGAGLIFPLFNGRALLLLWWIYGAICLDSGFTVLLVHSRSTVARAFGSGVRESRPEGTLRAIASVKLARR